MQLAGWEAGPECEELAVPLCETQQLPRVYPAGGNRVQVPQLLPAVGGGDGGGEHWVGGDAHDREQRPLATGSCARGHTATTSDGGIRWGADSSGWTLRNRVKKHGEKESSPTGGVEDGLI